MWKAEKNRKRIIEFLNLVENDKYELRKYSEPVLVYEVDENQMVKYSLWEAYDLFRYGLQNVDGHDFEDDIYFCPDWVAEENDEDDDIDDFDDD